MLRASSAIHFSPTRLLAQETRSEVSALQEKESRPCVLVTGESAATSGAWGDRRPPKYIAATIASWRVVAGMLPRPALVVFDEVQRLVTEKREPCEAALRWATTAGRRVVCCGPRSLRLEEELKNLLGREPEVTTLGRLSRLEFLEAPVRLRDCGPGDCVIGFSLGALKDLEGRLGGRSAVLHGSFPPDEKSFVAAGRGGKVLLATDAIGIGLNLREPVPRIIFSSLEKFDGECVRPLRKEEIRQIAGRAGRGPVDGRVGLLDGAHTLGALEKIRTAMTSADDPLSDWPEATEDGKRISLETHGEEVWRLSGDNLPL